MTTLLTDNLSLLAGAPNGIKKLRELILELAVRGKLVPQDLSDEPASKLLDRTAEEKARLVVEGKIKKQKPLAKIGEEEKPFELPMNWEWTRLGSQVIESGAGWSPSCDPRPREVNEWGVLKVSAVSWGIYQPEENKALPASLEARPEHEVAEGDFLVSRANTAELVARSVVVETTPSHLMLSDKIVRLKLASLCERRYVNFANSAPLARDYYSRVAGGTSSSMKNVSREQILNLPIALPPLAEQYRIVAKVDELMALCDRLEAKQAGAESAHARLVQALLDCLTQASDATDFAASWQRLAEHFHTLFTSESSIDALKQTLLQLAVMGKLVLQYPSDEPAGLLMTRLRQDRAEWLINSQADNPECKTMLRKLSSLPEASPPFPLPESWVTVHLIDCSRLLVDCHNKTAPYVPEGIPIIRTSNIRNREFRMDDLKYVNEETYEFWSRRCPPKPGDIMFTREAPMGEAAIIPDGARFCLGQRTMLVRTMHDYIDNRYLLITLTEPHLLERASTSAIGSTVKHLRVGDVEQLNIPLPPLAEQHRIVAKVDQLMDFCDRLKTRLTQARQLNEQLASTLVEKAVA